MQPFSDLLDAELLTSLATQNSVRRAAAACGLSQPAASRRLRLMERRLGVPLCQLSPTGARLTAAGLFWEAEARTLLGSLDQAASRFAHEHLGAAPRLRIAAGQVVADYLLPTWLLSWTNAGENRFCDVEVGNYTFVRDRVLAGKAELGLLELLSGASPPGLESISLLSDRCILVVSPSHTLAKRKTPLTLEELASMPLIQRESGSGTFLALSNMLSAKGYQLAGPAIEVGSASAVKSAVIQGLAPAVVPRISVTQEIESGRLLEVSVDGMDISLGVYAICQRVSRLSPAAKTFIAKALQSVPNPPTANGATSALGARQQH